LEKILLSPGTAKCVGNSKLKIVKSIAYNQMYLVFWSELHENTCNVS